MKTLSMEISLLCPLLLLLVAMSAAEEFLPGIDSKALKNGDPEPPITRKFRLYGMKFCPFTERVQLYMSRKNISSDVVNINLADKPDWYLQKHKKGTVPTLQLGDTIIGRDSMKIAELLDVIDPETTVLLENEDIRHEELKQATELSKKILPYLAALKRFGVENRKEAEGSIRLTDGGSIGLQADKWKEASEKITEARLLLQPIFDKSPYLSGEAPGFADYMIFPLMERFWILENMWHDKIHPETPSSEFSGWFGKMSLLPEVARVRQPLEDQIKHFETVFAGQPDYDLEANSTKFDPQI